ncbi:polyphenol oxidase family protein [Paraconexibacter antarcticus]|uniref:Polyphenol oxidase family protein n=1 Tax=Paraconexibacter antarcticus TaxID=2949664 RepID=A0ABY5DMT9_9ACTN|nr:polyphenol oxidase family protein [Paraconexibacter antarcticus]UTI62899.1 polyphenol oxidase family protein [Paraconexibacter antarcticus]
MTAPAPAPSPALPAGFRWDGPLLAVTLGGAEVRFTGRAGGVSTGPYASLDLARHEPARAGDVAANMERLARWTGVPVAQWVQSRQVHGSVVHRTTDAAALPDPAAEGDGQAITAPEVAGVVLTADCLPVVVAGAGGVAVLHAGWRGLADGILEAGVRALRELGVAGRLEAAIGPGAGGCCYDVGPDVRAAFAADGVLARAGSAPIDLKAIAARRLHAAGVATAHDAGLCTMCATSGDGERLFFSHRADGGTTGRQAGIAWLS